MLLGQKTTTIAAVIPKQIKRKFAKDAMSHGKKSLGYLAVVSNFIGDLLKLKHENLALEITITLFENHH